MLAQPHRRLSSPADRRGIVSRRALVLTIVVFGVGFFVVGPLRSWAQTLFATNNTRGVEFSRRVQARRLDAVRPELSQIGIDIDEPTDTAASSEPGTRPVPPAEVEPGWRARA